MSFIELLTKVSFFKSNNQSSGNFSFEVFKQNMLGKVGLLFLFIEYYTINGLYTCSSNVDCVVDCGTDSCLTTIDGTNALSLTVKCPAKCANISIVCPYNNNGNSLDCNVNCNEYGCYNTIIKYNEYTSLNIECKNNKACQYLSLLPTQSLIDSTQLNNTANVKCITAPSSISFEYVRYNIFVYI